MTSTLSFALVLIFVFSLTIPASAAIIDDVEPMYTHISRVYASLTIDESLGIATCTGSVNAKTITPAKVIVRLQSYQNGAWLTVKSWSSTGTAVASSTNSYAIYKGYSYRVYVTGYVYDSEGVIQESASIYDYASFF